jgi:4a-hydroxytetrahydrobiopterin dehydratase
LGDSVLNMPAHARCTMPRLLRPDEIDDELKKLQGWRVRRGFIVKVFDFEQFLEGIQFVKRVADVAEALEHHPDIKVRYTRVTLSIQTHSAGGVTKWDLQLAAAVDKLGPNYRKEFTKVR